MATIRAESQWIDVVSDGLFPIEHPGPVCRLPLVVEKYRTVTTDDGVSADGRPVCVCSKTHHVHVLLSQKGALPLGEIPQGVERWPKPK